MAFLAALSFLTVWRLAPDAQPTAADRGRSLFFFAPIGLLIGGVLVAVNYVGRLWWPSAVSSAVDIAALLLFTGGLHFDGLLDTCDGALSPRSPSRRLEIMRDSRSGAFAIAGGVIDLLLLWACIVDMTGPHQYAALLIAATVSRAAMAMAVVLFPYGRPSGLGKEFHDQASRWAALTNGLFAAAAGYALLGWQGLVAAIIALASGILAGMYLMTRLPGLTGDCYGAINEVVQVASLLALIPLL